VSVVSVVVVCWVGTCVGWGQEGHKIVADLASTRLTNTARQTVAVLLGAQTLPGIAPLPDDYDHNAAGKWSSPMHYVNLPRTAKTFQVSYCGTDLCVATAIVNYTARFTNDVTDPTPCDFTMPAEPCALEFLVHFTGDIHQPLHISYADDRGGNDVIVDFFGKQTNLHSVWDTYIISKWNADEASGTAELEDYIAKNPDVVKQYLASMDSSVWANESFQYVRTTCYSYNISNGVPQLEQSYYDINLPIIKQRLIAAGVRLAQAINTAVDGRERPWYEMVKPMPWRKHVGEDVLKVYKAFRRMRV